MAPIAISPYISYLLETQEAQFSDDFTSWNPVWGEPQPGVVDVWTEGGQMVLTPPEGSLPGGSAILASSAINAYHFALQYTLMFDNPEGLQDADKHAVFTHNFRAYAASEGYTLYLELDQAANDRYNWKVAGGANDISGTTSFLNLGEANLITVAYLEDECTIWINHRVLVHFFDQQHNGTVNRLGAHTDQGMLKVMIDDLKFWILEAGGLSPTPAPTRPAAQPWVVDFANPILESIALAAPTFQDDFAYRRAEWQAQGDVQFAEQMVVLRAEKDIEPPVLSGSPLQAGAFVLQFDLRAEFPDGSAQDTSADWASYLALDLAISENEKLAFYLVLNDAPGEVAEHTWAVYQFPENILLAQGLTPPFDPAEWTQIKVVFSTGELAFYLDGQPLGYVGGLSPTSQEITISAGAKASPFVLYIDDLQFWNLEQLGSGSSAEPFADFLQGRAPDFSDDFETLNPEWLVANGESSLENGRLLLATGPDGSARMGAAQLFARDFQLQYDFQMLAPGSAGAIISLEFRITDQVKYVFNVNFLSDPVTWEFTLNDQVNATNQLASGSLPGMDASASHQIKGIAAGSQFWIYLDDTLLTNLRDSRLAEGEISLVVKSGNEAATVAIDNFSFWNLDNAWTWELPSVVQQAVLESPPDFEDDFSTEKPEWQVEPGYLNGYFEWVDGALRAPGAPLTIGDDLLRGTDYVFQTDLRLSEVSENMEFLYASRLTETGEGIGTEYLWILNTLTKEWSLSVNLSPSSKQYQTLLSGQLSILEAGQWANFTVIVYEDTLWIYWNGELEVYYQGLELWADINHFVLSPSSGNPYLELDNWKFWNLSSSSGYLNPSPSIYLFT
jgi:hypothetical protein